MESLNSKSLMIGDWVMYDNEPNIIAEVSEIYQNEATVCFVGNNHMANIDEIEPIPLTQEIFKKNGFVLKPDGWIWCDCDGIEDQNYIFIQFRKGCDEVRRCEINYVNKAQATYYQIKYIHQLQQALKLCGIKKGIKVVNF